MTLAAYTGHEPLTFPDYTDLDTGRTLAAEPGRTYDLAPASGRMVADVPEGWFVPVAGHPEEEPPASEPETAEPAESAPPQPGEPQPPEPAEPAQPDEQF